MEDVSFAMSLLASTVARRRDTIRDPSFLDTLCFEDGLRSVATVVVVADSTGFSFGIFSVVIFMVRAYEFVTNRKILTFDGCS